MSLDELRERSRAVWSTGNYEPTSRQLEPASVALVEALGITAEHQVLDVAAGHGNCALAAARRGATVVASDFSPAMIAAGRSRTDAAGVRVEWREANAEALPFAAATFDRVTSVFGMIFAPDQGAAGGEVVRVLRSGGKLGLTAWTRDSVVAEVMAVGRSFGPPLPDDAPDPLRWSDPEALPALLDGCSVASERATLTFHYDSWDHWQRANDGHGSAVLARQMLAPEIYTELQRRLREVTAAHNIGTQGAVLFEASYLQIIATKA